MIMAKYREFDCGDDVFIEGLKSRGNRSRIDEENPV